MPSEDNKRIATNTIFLYMRMFLTIIVNLYTFRIIWQVLGVDDYGIYNVVGGIVMMFSFLNTAMIVSSQRFISFELGRNNKDQLNKVFSICVTVHSLLAIVVFVLAETAGLWFLNNKLNIPEGRMLAANWVYQCSIIAFIITIISVPYNSCIVAHEHMKVYGYLGILDVILKLITVFLLIFIPFDKLITYSILVLIVSVLMRIIYQIYCKQHFDECKIRKVHDSKLMKDMFSFSGWSFVGSLGYSLKDQGINILLNIFFSVAINAARGIANQIGTTINGLASNFQMAINPQITKRYAANDLNGMIKLVFLGCRFSVLLMAIITTPLIIAAEEILILWLGNCTEYTIGFLQLTLCLVLIESIINPITTAIQATGHIRNFQIIISIIMLLNLPISWLLLRFDANPYIVLFVAITISILGIMVRLRLLHGLILFSYKKFITEVFIRIIPVVFFSFVISICIYRFIPKNIGFLILFVAASVFFTILLIFCIGINKTERQAILKVLRQRFFKPQ